MNLIPLLTVLGGIEDTQVVISFKAVLIICGAIMTIGGATVYIIKIIKKIKQPEETQNQKITNLENRVTVLEGYSKSVNDRIKVMEEGMKVTQQALLAIMSYEINGNDIDKLKQAKDDLEEYLIKR